MSSSRETGGRSEAICRLCGIKFLQSQGRGRPRQFCSDECRQAEKHLVLAEVALTKIPIQRKSALWIRGRLWLLGNQLSSARS